MAKSSKVTVWNAAQHVLKVGPRRLLLHPGTSFVVDRDDELDFLVNSGKLVVLEETQAPAVADEPAKKKKKEVTGTVEESSVEEDAPSNESAEDSILPEEVD